MTGGINFRSSAGVINLAGISPGNMWSLSLSDPWQHARQTAFQPRIDRLVRYKYCPGLFQRQPHDFPGSTWRFQNFCKVKVGVCKSDWNMCYMVCCIFCQISCAVSLPSPCSYLYFSPSKILLLQFSLPDDNISRPLHFKEVAPLTFGAVFNALTVF